MLATSCSDDRLDVNTSNIDVDLDVYRLDLFLDSIAQNQEPPSIEEIRNGCGSFATDYIENVLQIGPADSSASMNTFLRFAQLEDTKAGLKEIAKAHPNERIEQTKAQLEVAFEHYLYHFPNATIPQVSAMYSGFNFSVYPYNEDHLGIGLDYFLGAKSELIGRLDPNLFPQYIRNKMEPKYVPTSAIRGWLLIKHQEHYDPSTLLSTIMYWGKVMYMMDACFVDQPNHLKMDYTPIDIEWCKQNERNTWIELSHQDVIYQTKAFEIEKWTSEGPFTSAGTIPQDSPSRLGVWMGWQIVRDYMNKNPEVTLEELLNETNYIKLLNAYKPG